MEYFRLMGLCVVVLLPCAILKREASEQSVLLILGVVILVAFRAVTMTAPLLKTFEAILSRVGVEDMYMDILLRSVAVSLVSHLCANLCRDGGSQALASVVELSGAVAVLVIALPLLEAVTDLLMRYF